MKLDGGTVCNELKNYFPYAWLSFAYNYHPILYNRGGASKVSGATFTNHVAGNRAISDMVAYPSYTTCINTRACAHDAELALVFYRERNSDLDIVNFL